MHNPDHTASMGDSVLDHDTTLQIAVDTDRGLVRSQNEDSYSYVVGQEHDGQARGSILVVADGMGGYSAGATASTIVTTELPRAFYRGSGRDPVGDLMSALTAVNTRVHQAVERKPGEPGMGTTVVACVVRNQHLITANVGDSRAYIFRKDELRQLTLDHTLAAESNHRIGLSNRERFAHVLTQAIGPHPKVAPYLTVTHLQAGDLILLCSDGLTTMLTDAEIESVISQNPVAGAVSKLVAVAIHRGGKDNLTVLLASVLHVVESDEPLQCITPTTRSCATGHSVPGANFLTGS